MKSGTHGTMTVGGKTVKVGAWTITPAAPPPVSAYERPEWLSFLRAILTEPAEDHHRLVLADWLEEHGERERADCIRWQCRPDCRHTEWPLTGADGRPIAKIQPGPPVRRPLTPAAIRKLVANPPKKGLGPMCRIPPWEYPTVRGTVSRGFVSAVTCTAQDWLAHADALCWHPSQTVECRAKGCEHGTIGRPRPGDVGGQWMGRMCDACDGMGRIPRPVPPTAQPIERVTLTGEITGRIIEQVCARLSTAPNHDSPYPDATRGVLWASGFPRDRYSDTVLAVFGRVWRGIAITHPPS